MGRQSRIDKHGLGPKVVAYAKAGYPHSEIIAKIKQEHAGIELSFSQVSRYLQAYNANIASEMPPQATDVKEISLAVFREELLAAINTAKSRYAAFKNDPKSGLEWFKVHLSNLDRMAKSLGCYGPDNQVNVGIRVDGKQCDGCPYKEKTTQTVPEKMAEYTEYFKEVDRVAAELDGPTVTIEDSKGDQGGDHQ